MISSDCPWCALLRAPGRPLHKNPRFAVLRPGDGPCLEGGLILVPRAHVAVLSQLSREEMGVILATLTEVASRIKVACQYDEVGIVAHRRPEAPSHVHFHLVGRAVDLDDRKTP